jgi:hypothetical protein
MKKLLIFTDSLGLPRDTPELVSYEETWAYKLKEFFNVHQVSIGGGTIKDLHQQMDYSKMFCPDFVIIQSGIVDCAPRALTKFENELLNKFWLTRTFLDYWLNARSLMFLRKRRNVTYTNKTAFDYYSGEFLKLFGSKLYWVEILNAGDEYDKLLPGIKKNVSIYNQIIKNKIGEQNIIDISTIPKNGIMKDYIHLSVLGHDYLFNQINKTLQKKNK